MLGQINLDEKISTHQEKSHHSPTFISLFQEVWDKDPLSQERMGQIGFTTEKLKDLGKVTT